MLQFSADSKKFFAYLTLIGILYKLSISISLSANNFNGFAPFTGLPLTR
jgi:hypothetical protein